MARETQNPPSLWDETAAQHAAAGAAAGEFDPQADLRSASGLPYRFPKTPPRMRLGDVQLRYDESVPGRIAFRRVLDRVQRVSGRRTPEAVLVRALRRWLVRHVDEVLANAREHTWRGRVVTEEDVETLLERAFCEPRELHEPEPQPEPLLQIPA